MDKISLKVVVAGRSYPLSLNPGEEDKVLNAADGINKAIQVLQQNYAVKDMQDLLAMAALQLATKSGGPVVESSIDEKEIEKALDNLKAELDSL